MSSTTISKKPERLIHMDLLRLLAIFLVIFNHTSDRGYFLFAHQAESPFYIIYMLASVFCKIAVPLFFMISGALLLGREESLKQLFTKRILRMAIVLLLISVPYYLWLHRAEGISVGAFFSYIYGNSASTSLWYLYSYIGLLLILPFLRKMVKGLQERDYIYLFVGQILLVGFVPCLEYLLWQGGVTIHESFSAAIFTTQNVFYALMGYYLERVLDKKYYKAKNIWISLLLSGVALIITCLMTVYLTGQMTAADDPNKLETFFNCFISIPTVAVYFVAKHLGEKIQSQKLKSLLQVLGSAVFGVYLIEKIVRSLVNFIYTLLAPIVGSFIASLIWTLGVLCISLLIIVPLKHIPGLKKIVNKFI